MKVKFPEILVDVLNYDDPRLLRNSVDLLNRYVKQHNAVGMSILAIPLLHPLATCICIAYNFLPQNLSS